MESNITKSSPKRRKELKKEFIKRHSVLVNKAVDEGAGSDAAKEMIKLIKVEVEHLKHSQSHGIYVNISMLCMNMRIDDEIEYIKPSFSIEDMIGVRKQPEKIIETVEAIIEPIKQNEPEEIPKIDIVDKIKQKYGSKDESVIDVLKEIEENKKKPYKFS